MRAVPPFEWDPNLKPDPAALTAMQATYRALGLLQYAADLPAGGFVDDSFSKRAATAFADAAGVDGCGSSGGARCSADLK